MDVGVRDNSFLNVIKKSLSYDRLLKLIILPI